MKYPLLFVFIISLLAKPSFGEEQSDSLWNVWADTEQADSSRIKALCEYGKTFARTNPDSAIFYAQKGYDYADSKQMLSSMALAKTFLGHAYQQKRDYENSFKAYSEAIEFSRQVGDSNIVAVSLSSIGSGFYSQGEYNEARYYYERSILVYKGLDNKIGMSDMLNNLGIINIIQNNYDEATEDLNKSIQYAKESGKLETVSGPMTNLAILKSRQGDYAAAIELYMKSLTVNEQLGDEYALGYTHNNLANLYYIQGDTVQYFENMNKSLEIRRRLDDKRGIMKCQISLGMVYEECNQDQKALDSFNESLAIAQEIGNKKSIASSIMGIALIDLETERLDDVLNKLNLGLQINEELEDQYGICQAKKAIGDYYRITGNNKRALEFYSEAIVIAQKTDIQLEKEIAFDLYEVYELEGEYQQAFDAYKIYISARDSIKDEENQKEIINQELKYEYDKKAVADSLSFAAQREIQKTKLEQTKNQRKSLFIVLLVVLGFTALLFNRVTLIRRQKVTIEEQNHKLNNLNENLEQKVEDRTQKIVEINNNLKKSDERYTYALEASNDGIWDYNVKEDRISFSPAIYTMLGFEPFEFPESREGIYKLLHSDELKIEKRKTHNIFLIQNEEDYLLDEYRLVKKGGEIAWIQVKGKVVEKDKNGTPLRIVGTHTDITADKLKNQKLLEAVLKTEDAERSRISKDIHDGLQQTLTISLLNFQNLKKDLGGLGTKSMEKFNIGWKYLQESIAESRNVAHTLMPKAIVDFGILAAFESLIDAVDKSNETTSFHFSHNLKSKKLSNQQIEITLYRILQEAINNINKYAEASNVYIQLKEYDDIFMLTIEDDGQGFDSKTIKEEGSGLGITSMQNRLDAINGYFEINSEIGEGTNILVEINKVLVGKESS